MSSIDFDVEGQGNYAAANACLDAFAPYWSAKGRHRLRDLRSICKPGPTVSVQWGPWARGSAMKDT